MDLIAKRRADPQDDLISLWTQAPSTDDGDAGRPWTDGEILSECLLLLDGGAETTRTVIGATIRELALQPDQRKILLDRPEALGETAVEEFIRWVTPILNMRRTVTEDHELHGKQLRTGDEVLLMYASANRDDRVFEDPDRFDVLRPVNHHVAFGFGTHFCLGASLARLEIRVMFEELLKRMPDWRLAPGAEPRIVPATFARAYDSVPIEFTPGPRLG
jgi:cytochrome P450 family 142 subfamily A polypeptide 1